MGVRSIEAPPSHKVVIMLSHEEYLELHAQAEEQQGARNEGVLRPRAQSDQSQEEHRQAYVQVPLESTGLQGLGQVVR